MTSLPRQILRQQAGMILPLVLVTMAVGLLIITPTLGHGYVSLQATEVVEDRADELYAADSGIEEALYWLISGHEDNLYWNWDDVNGGGSREPYALNGCTVEVTVEPLPSVGNNYYLVTSIATGPRGNTTVLSQVWAAPEAHEGLPGGTYEGDVYVDGDGTMQSHDQIIGDVVVTGDFTMNAQSQVDGSREHHESDEERCPDGADVEAGFVRRVLGDQFEGFIRGYWGFFVFFGQGRVSLLSAMSAGAGEASGSVPPPDRP